MSEQKTIPTTTITTTNVNLLEINTFFNRNKYTCAEEGYTDYPYIKETTITDFVGTKNGVNFLEGKLLIVAENLPSLVDIWIDNNGNLIVKGDDNGSYSIDSNGHLIYDICATVDDGCNDNLILEGELTDTVGTKNGTPFIEGALLITADDLPSLIDADVDSNGNLIIVGSQANRYSIDENGHLVFECFQ